ncbi:MAG: acyl carrier protein [Actinomycetota bacterium]|nr:acyl carrier protein [Actinomycetota bacterium]
MTPGTALTDRIRQVLDAEARLPVPAAGLADEDDLFRSGLSSHSSVSVMLALEELFGVEFPDALLSRQTFQSIRSIATALRSLGVEDTSSGD